MDTQKNTNNKKRLMIILGCLLLFILIGLLIFLLLPRGGSDPSAPAVTVESPEKMDASDRNPFPVRLYLSSLKDDDYPAASFSIRFDPSKLEFLGIDEGNVIIKSADSTTGTTLPEWSVNVERSNKTGIINILYLDMTGGKYAFSKDLLADGDHVLLQMNFRLRGSVRPGDILELGIDDAVFAAIDETKSLASNQGTLQTVNGRIVIGGAK